MDQAYCTNPQLIVEPDHVSDGVPVFKPSMEQFKDFYAFNKAINKYGMELGIVKIIPPPEWRASLPRYTPKILEKVKIKNPIVQHIHGGVGGGVFSLQNIEKQRTYTLLQWKDLSTQSNYLPPAPKGKVRNAPVDKVEPTRQLRNGNSGQGQQYKNYNIDTSEFTDERCEQLEKSYWKTLTYAEPMYGADTLGSLFPSNFKTWNVAKLPNILDLLDAKLPGVNDAYLYAGLWKATFSWHLEDQDLYSINYLHFGAPKQWYSIPQSQAAKFYNLMKDSFPEDSRSCLEFLRHKTFMMSPQYLSKRGIKVNKVVHREGEFMITYPYGYHSGFNYGYNLAESVNFALDDWFPFGESSKKCECISDAVGINVRHLYCKFNGIDFEEEQRNIILEREKKEKEMQTQKLEEERIRQELSKQPRQKKLTTKKQQQQSHISQQHEQIIKTNKPSTKESRAKESRANESTVKEEIKMVNTVSRARPRKYSVPSSISFQCLLCPNNLPKPLLKLKQFQLLETDSGENVHRICSEQFKELNNNHEVISGFSDIVKAQKDLKCLVCQTQKKNKLTSANDHGVCFQCEHPKCVRSYHATCAIGAGFSFDSVNRISKCKFHRGKLVFHKLNKIKFDRVSKIAKNSIIQFTTLAKETYSGLVMTNHSDEGIIKVSVYPHLREIMEIPYDNVLMSDDENIDSTQNIGLMFEKAKPNLKKDRDNYKVIFDDLIVTGINSPYLERSIDDNFITETFIKEEQKGRYARFEWWYFMPKFSTDAIAKYSDDYRSKEPNDPYHLLKLERKLKRQNKTKEVNNHLTKKFKHVSPPMIPLGSSNQVNNNIGNNSYLAQPNAVYFPGVTNPIMVNSHFVPYNQGQNNLIPPPQNVMFMTPPITTDGNPWLNMYQH